MSMVGGRRPRYGRLQVLIAAWTRIIVIGQASTVFDGTRTVLCGSNPVIPAALCPPPHLPLRGQDYDIQPKPVAAYRLD